jgi:hypothetical protein
MVVDGRASIVGYLGCAVSEIEDEHSHYRGDGPEQEQPPIKLGLSGHIHTDEFCDEKTRTFTKVGFYPSQKMSSNYIHALPPL